MWLLFISFLILFEAGADILAKEWQLHSTWLRFAAAIAAYVIANIFWLLALKYGAGLTKGAIIFSVGSAIFAILIGLVLYKEPITRLQIIGLVLGVSALILLTWKGDS